MTDEQEKNLTPPPPGGTRRFGERVLDLAALVGWMLFLSFCLGAMAALCACALLIIMAVMV